MSTLGKEKRKLEAAKGCRKINGLLKEKCPHIRRLEAVARAKRKGDNNSEKEGDQNERRHYITFFTGDFPRSGNPSKQNIKRKIV